MGYNEIEDLFDIGFIEHLRVLDFEGNNISDYEQLYYLSRCTKLTHLNLKYTPIARGKKVTGEDVSEHNQPSDNIKLYYQKVQRWCQPSLVHLVNFKKNSEQLLKVVVLTIHT